MAETRRPRRYGAVKLSFEGFPLVGSEGSNVNVLAAHLERIFFVANGGVCSAMSCLSNVWALGCIGGASRPAEQ